MQYTHTHALHTTTNAPTPIHSELPTIPAPFQCPNFVLFPVAHCCCSYAWNGKIIGKFEEIIFSTLFAFFRSVKPLPNPTPKWLGTRTRFQSAMPDPTSSKDRLKADPFWPLISWPRQTRAFTLAWPGTRSEQAPEILRSMSPATSQVRKSQLTTICPAISVVMRITWCCITVLRTRQLNRVTRQFWSARFKAWQCPTSSGSRKLRLENMIR